MFVKKLAIIGSAVLFSVLLVARTVSASPDYPEALEKAADAPCPPPCTVCHRDTNGGAGTVVKPFGEAMINAGLDANDVGLLQTAVDTLRQDKTDSDGDGTSDIDELAQGQDPNAAGNGALCGPTYGCGARVEARGPVDGVGALATLGVLLLLGASTRRSRRARQRFPSGTARR